MYIEAKNQTRQLTQKEVLNMAINKLRITPIGNAFYEVEVPQDDEEGTVIVYTVSETDLKWLRSNNKSKWEVKYVACETRVVPA